VELNFKDLFNHVNTIAIVGLSDNPDRPSYEIAAYLQSQGFKIIPVNPNATEILGECCYPDLRSIPIKVDLVNVFRRAQDCPLIAKEAVDLKPLCLWLQSGIVSPESEKIAHAAHIPFIMDRCIKVVHRSIKDER